MLAAVDGMLPVERRPSGGGVSIQTTGSRYAGAFRVDSFGRYVHAEDELSRGSFHTSTTHQASPTSTIHRKTSLPEVVAEAVEVVDPLPLEFQESERIRSLEERVQEMEAKRKHDEERVRKMEEREQNAVEATAIHVESKKRHLPKRAKCLVLIGVIGVVVAILIWLVATSSTNGNNKEPLPTDGELPPVVELPADDFDGSQSLLLPTLQMIEQRGYLRCSVPPKDGFLVDLVRKVLLFLKWTCRQRVSNPSRLVLR